MKKQIKILLTLVLCMMLLSQFSYADEAISDLSAQMQDGYFVITVRTLDSVQSTTSDSVSGASDMTFYNNNGVAQWTYTVMGTFTKSGSAYVCSSASSSVTIHVSGWSCTSKNVTKSGNQAIGTATLVYKVLGVPVNTKNVCITLSCDANGTITSY